MKCQTLFCLWEQYLKRITADTDLCTSSVLISAAWTFSFVNTSGSTMMTNDSLVILRCSAVRSGGHEAVKAFRLPMNEINSNFLVCKSKKKLFKMHFMIYFFKKTIAGIRSNIARPNLLSPCYCTNKLHYTSSTCTILFLVRTVSC